MKNKNINPKTIKILIAILVSLSCFYYLIISFKWKEIWQSFQTADISKFLLGSSITLLGYFFLRAVRWYLLLKGENFKVSLLKLYLYNSISIGFSTITPFQSGEALKVEFLQKNGGSRISGYSTFFLERLLDLLNIICLGILGIYLGFDFGIPLIYFYFLAAILLFFSISLISFILFFPSQKLYPVKFWIKELWQKKLILLFSLFLTILSWIAVILGWKIALESVAININFLQTITLVSLTTLVSILSFVPGAIGVSELSISTILIKMDITNSMAQTGAVAIRMYALMILVLTFLHWIILKFSSRKEPLKS